MEGSGIGMVGCVVAYLVSLILLIVILVKVNRIAKVQDRSGPAIATPNCAIERYANQRKNMRFESLAYYAI
jgi:hypothetical protein